MESHFKADVASVIERSALAGVLKLVNIGCNLEGSRESDRMSREGFLEEMFFGLEKDMKQEQRDRILPGIFGSQGIHPHDSNETTDEVMGEFLNAIHRNKKIVVIGETGLDYFYMKQPKEIQIESLRKHMQLAQETRLPVSIHCRDPEKSFEAREDMLRMLSEFPGVRCVMHCYSQDRAYAEEVLAMPVGHIISFSGTVSYPSADPVRQVAAMIPADRIVVETDCPYLTPQAFRGKRNEPAFVVETAKVVAELRGESLEKFSEISSTNAERFFEI